MSDSKLQAMAALVLKQQPPLNICACMGPQNGQPLCPCAMKNVQIKNGRYVMPERDLGPVNRAIAIEKDMK